MARTQNLIRQEQFIAEYIENGGLRSKAAAKLDIPERTVNLWFQDKRFRGRLSKATSKWRELLHAAGMRRALAGSDRLLEYFLTRFDTNFDPGIRRLKYEKRNGLGQFAKKEADPTGQALPQRIVLVREPLPPPKSTEGDDG